MKRNRKLCAIVFGGIIIAVVFSAFLSSRRAKAGESRVVTQERIMRYLVGTDEFSDREKASADINSDGVINMLDALIIERIEVYGEDYVVEDNKTPADKVPANETAQPQPTKQATKQPQVQPAKTATEAPNSEPKEETRMVYLNIGSSGWEKVYMYSWETGEKFTQMTPVDGEAGVFSVALPKDVKKFLFVDNNEKIWNGGRQSVDLSYTINGSIYTFGKKYDGKYQGSWSTEAYKK